MTYIMVNRLSDEKKARSIELLIDGKTIDEVSEETGVNRNTLMYWRQQSKKLGIEFPTHNRGGNVAEHSRSLPRYSDEEIIILALQNPGFGLQRFVKQLYPKTKKIAEYRFDFTMLFQDYRDEFGEDLIEHLQDSNFIQWVSHDEYFKITGSRNIPDGFGRRGSSTGKRGNKDSHTSLVPLPPQKFNWGKITKAESRSRHRFEKK